jgi:hypothetical protein
MQVVAYINGQALVQENGIERLVPLSTLVPAQSVLPKPDPESESEPEPEPEPEPAPRGRRR